MSLKKNFSKPQKLLCQATSSSLHVAPFLVPIQKHGPAVALSGGGSLAGMELAALDAEKEKHAAG